jgi:3-oxoacyl-[acyl-carrier protein] reductase
MKTALVLGGSGDIGSAIGSALAKNFLVTSVGSKDMDLSSELSINEFMQGKTYDVLVHSAGLNIIGTLENRDVQDIEQAVQTNLMGFLHITKHLIPYWKHQNYGRIVVISSLYGFLSRQSRMPYVISKHGLVGAVKTLALELAQYGVLSNCVSPGYINTKMTSKNNSPETIARLVQGIPQGRMGTPEDIAKVVDFLISENTYINGQDIVVDGGYSVGGFQA